MSILMRGAAKSWMIVALLALIGSGIVQRHVESRRQQEALTWTEKDKDALEVGFMALGGFRGVLADILWIRAIGHQDKKNYYELKLICDMILKLQPTFTGVHAFQAYNMSYNLAYRAETCEDKWYWIRAGISMLEKGLERNSKNYNLWFELGYQYFDRLGNIKMGDCASYRDRQLPLLKDLSEDDRMHVFLGEQKWKPGAPPNEHLRYAAYYFWKAMKTGNDPVPIRTERQFGQCIEHLGHWYSANKKPEDRDWFEWSAEDWWVELIRRNKERGDADNETVPTNLRFSVYIQMDYYEVHAAGLRAKGDVAGAEKDELSARNAYTRYQKYFPENKKSLAELLAYYRDYRDRPALGKSQPFKFEPAER